MECRSGAGLAHKHYFRALITFLQDCFALWGKQKYNSVAYNVQSDISLWDKDAWKHRVVIASTELDLFIILCKIAILWKFLMIEWAMLERHKQLRIRSYKETRTTRITPSCIVSPTVPISRLFSSPPRPSGLSVFSPTQICIITLSGNQKRPHGLVSASKCPYILRVCIHHVVSAVNQTSLKHCLFLSGRDWVSSWV